MSRRPTPPLDTLTTFGAALRYARRAAQLTQRELAIAVGYSREQMNRLENDQRTPDLDVVRTRLLEALELEPSTVLAQHLIALAASLHAGDTLLTDQSIDVSLKRSSINPTAYLLTPLTPFVGRVDDVREGLHLLEQTRLLVLVGAGGIGKTRLAYAIASAAAGRFLDRVFVVELAPISEPARTAERVAAALGLPDAREHTVEQQLIEHLRGRSALLVLDNCEHLLMAAAHLAEVLLRGCPQLCVLATSRQAFGTLSARTWRVPPLNATDAVALFADRARQVRHRFELTPRNSAAIAAICAQLDGLPLAIELAAARMRVLSAEQIAERLSDRLGFLTSAGSTAIPRQQTLRAAIEWSYTALDEDERTLLRRLAVFAGGWTLDAAEASAGNTGTDRHDNQRPVTRSALDVLTSLVDKSLVVADEREDDTRFSMLGTIRDFAREKLWQAGEEAEAHEAHLGFVLALLMRGEPALRTAEQRRWYLRYQAERENVRAALEWAIRQGDKDSGVRLIATMWFYWFWRGHWAEGTRWARAVFALPGDADPLWHSRALVLAASLPGRMGDFATFALWLRQGQAVNDTLGDTATMAWARISGSYLERDPAQAIVMKEEALRLARLAGDHWNVGNILYNLGDRYRGAGKIARAEALYRESVAAFRSAGDRDIIAFPIGNLGRIAFARGDDGAARRAFEEGIRISQAAGNVLVAADWHLQLARVALRTGDEWQAAASITFCLQTYMALGNLEGVADTLVLAADLRQGAGEVEQAARLLGAAEQLYATHHVRRDLVEGDNQNYLHQCLDRVRQQMEEGAYERARAHGRELNVEEAAALVVRI